MGEAISEAMRIWTEEKRQKSIAEEMLALMEKGFDIGKIQIKTREELYER